MKRNKLREDLQRCAENGVWWEPDGRPTVPAGWIRELVAFGTIPATDVPVHAKGVRVRGVVIDGSLDFEGAQLAVPVHLDSVEVSEPILLEEASGGWISITDSRLGGVSGHQLTLEHSLVLSGSNSNGPLNLEGAQIAGGVFLNDRFAANGEVRLSGADIGGQLVCSGGSFDNNGADAFNVDNANIGGDVALDDDFAANGAVRLLGVTIGGQLTCRGGRFNNPGGAALVADRATIAGGAFLDHGFAANGEVRLLGAMIGAPLVCRGGSFYNRDRPALNAEDGNISGSVYLDDGFAANGEVRLSGARITGNLECRGSNLDNPSGNALALDRSQITGDVLLGDGFAANGEVRLARATIGGALICNGGSFTNEGGVAFSAHGTGIAGGVFLDSRFNATGEFRLVDSTIGGRLICRESRFSNPDGFGLILRGATINGAFIWQPKEVVKGTGIDLTSCSVGPLVDDIESWRNGPLSLDGFIYAGFAGAASWSVIDRIAWIGRQGAYHSQPYEQLGRVYRDAGRISAARKVAVAREKARGQTLGWWQRPWHTIWGWWSGFGFAPARPLFVFAALLLAGAGFFWWAGESGAMEPTDLTRKASATECTGAYPCYHPFIYAADVMVPIVNLGQRDAWTPDVARVGAGAEGWPWAVGGASVRSVTVFLAVAGFVLTGAFVAAVGSTISRS